MDSSNMWERLWRGAGIQSVIFLVVAWIVYGDQPGVGASPEALVSFYDGDRTRILIASVILGLGVLNLLWFAAAINIILRDAGQGGWAAAATASSAAVGAIVFVLITMSAGLAYSVAGTGNVSFVSGLNDFSWALIVMSSFPRAMLIMASAFGLWRAGILSNALFAGGVACVVLGVAGGTTWASDGFWAPDGVYSQFIWPIIGLAWITIVSAVLMMPRRSSAGATERAPAPAPAW